MNVCACSGGGTIEGGCGAVELGRGLLVIAS